MGTPDWGVVLGRYGRHLHSVAGAGHRVVSPLGAWMVLALCGGLAETDPIADSELGELFGHDPLQAAAFAAELLRTPHPLVAAGAGLWVRAHMDTAEAARWRSRLPEQVDTGDVPSQEKLDRWAAERTLGLIRRFPLAVSPDAVCILASALATKVSWEVPFQVADASELGPRSWDRSVTRVLRTPPDPRHRQFLTDTATVGPAAVHLAEARGGLLVGSVIAVDSSVSDADVLAEAERIVTGEAWEQGSTKRLSLFDLPIGPGPVWDITEEPDGHPGPFDRDERFTTLLPAWSAKTDVDLGGTAELGFAVAAAAIARALKMEDWRYDARQAAVATYSRVGFEAAAVTGLAIACSGRPAPTATPRRAVVRFRHPYAVVAATRNDPREPSSRAWHGLPVFTAWVTETENAEPASTARR